MATLFRIARGSKASLDKYDKRDGTFYIITEDDAESGDLYLDIGEGDAGRRIKLGGGAAAKSESEWSSSEETSEKGTFYIVSDAHGTIPGLKIGDGETPIKDLPIVTVSPSQVDSWNKKVTCDIDLVPKTDENGNIVIDEDGKPVMVPTENLVFDY